MAIPIGKAKETSNKGIISFAVDIENGVLDKDDVEDDKGLDKGLDIFDVTMGDDDDVVVAEVNHEYLGKDEFVNYRLSVIESTMKDIVTKLGTL